MANVDYGNSLSTAGQFPLDGKRRFKTISDMQVLGTNAFKYYEDMIVQCLENHKQYIWRERLDTDKDDDGVIAQDFVYPTGAVADGISYQGRSFNFFEFKTGSSVEQDNKTKVLTIDEILYTPPTEGDRELAKRTALANHINNLNPPLEILEDENLYIVVNTFINNMEF